VIRRARREDLGAIVRIFGESRAEAMPWLPVLHTAEEDLDHFRGRLDRHEVFVFEREGGPPASPSCTGTSSTASTPAEEEA
jgi:hypothetical protein